ncbi:MAG: mitofilin family membrane protein [Rhodospirillales bacterium]
MAITPNSADDPQKPDKNKPKKTETAETAAAKTPSGGGKEKREPRDSVTFAGARTGLAAFAWCILGFAVLIGAGYATAPFWFDRVKPYLPAALKDPFEDPRIVAVAERAKAVEGLSKAQETDAQAIKKLEEERSRFSGQLNELLQRLEAQDKALKSMQKMIQATTPPSQAADADKSITRLSEKLSHVEENADALEQMLKRIEKLERDEREIAKITERLGSLEKTGPQAMDAVTGASATVLAVNQLRETLRRSGPFDKELSMVKQIAGDNPDMKKAIGALEPLAEKGVATREILRARFAKTARAVVKAVRLRSEQGWTDRIINSVKGLVTIRRLDDDGSGGVMPETLVMRAEESLAMGNLPAAVQSVEKLTGAPAEAAADWLEAAQNRLAAERALATLHVQAVALLAPASKK